MQYPLITDYPKLTGLVNVPDELLYTFTIAVTECVVRNK